MDNIFSSARDLLAQSEVQMLLAVFSVLAIFAVLKRVFGKPAPRPLASSPLTAASLVTPPMPPLEAEPAPLETHLHAAQLAMINHVSRDDQSEDRHVVRAQDEVGAEILECEDAGEHDFNEVEAMSVEAARAKCAALLILVKQHLESGAAPAAAVSLRELVRFAAASGLNDQHAAARLELGELARKDGDLITACEHWQIARGLFHDLKNGPNLKTVETQMRDHGCPTDWVLNDF